jgi:hypothetical protein
VPIPSLLACGAVHQHLIAAQARTRTGLLVEAGDAKEPHDFCTLIGYGADAVCPHAAYAAVAAFHAPPEPASDAAEGGPTAAERKMEVYRQSAGKALLKEHSIAWRSMARHSIASHRIASHSIA